jgi:RNA polymerase sigma-70 factor (ECF subfamily)
LDEQHDFFGKFLTLMVDDRVLIKQLQNKDEIALSQLYDKYSSALFGVIIRICRDEQHAQNILQDTFMTIWEKSNSYDANKGRFYTWAYRIAKNKTLNFIRNSGSLIQTEDLSVHSNKEDEITIDPEFYQLNGLINKLEKHHQKALELVYFKGMTHKEAHAEMEVPLGTFKSYIRQAIRQLQETYTNTIALVMVIIDLVG